MNSRLRVLFIKVPIAVLLFGLLLFAGLYIYAFSGSDTDKTLFINGTVLPVVGEPAEALLVEDGRITAIGKQRDLIALAGDDVNVIDLNGGALLPGLIEPHTHPIATALLGATVDVSGASHRSRAEVMQTLADAVDRFSPNGWVIAFGWDPVMIADLEPPTLAELDALSPDKPLLILTQMMHDAYANSAALAAAGITKDTPDPVGGEFVKTASGELSGTIREISAINMVFDAVPQAPGWVVKLLTQLQLQRYAAAGYTSIGVLGPVGRSEEPLALLEDLLNDDDAPVRARVWALPAQLDDSDTPNNTPRYGLRGVKFWMDGSPFAGGAAWEEPYENSELVIKRLGLPHNHLPALNFNQEEFEQIVKDYHQRGFAVAVHTHGERAIDRALDAFESALKAYPRSDHRHRLEHNALITPQQIARARRLGVTLSFFVDHIWFYGHRLAEFVGEQRSARYMPVAEAIRQGHRVSIHGDHPATPIAPFRSMKTAVTRSMRLGDGQLGASQAINVSQALRAMTIDAAWQLGIDQEVGSLEVGKAADLLWVNENPLTQDPQALDQIEVIGTWIDGRRIDSRWYSRRNAQVLLQQLL